MARILILVENLSVPMDRRVWQESVALHEAGHEITVVCPRGRVLDREAYQLIDGIEIHRYPLVPVTKGRLGYVREYAQALWHTLRLTLRLNARRRFDIVHICNPPDLLFLCALPLKARGARIVYDQHDLVPELVRSRFNGDHGVLYALARVLERLTYATADHVLATNESYRRIAVTRGRVNPDRVTVVRSAPDLARFVAVEPRPELRRGKRHLLCYLGVMGPQDGVDFALRALAILRNELGRSDFHAVFVGDGDVREEMVVLAASLGLADDTEFPGRVPNDDVAAYLSTADVCLAPDPKNALNDVSSMNKVVEYMALGRPLVSFDLVEARRSAGYAAVYARPNDERHFAEEIAGLLEDPERRRSMGAFGRARIELELSWEHSRAHLVAAYDRVLGRGLGERLRPERESRPERREDGAERGVLEPVGLDNLAETFTLS